MTENDEEARDPLRKTLDRWYEEVLVRADRRFEE
jgi:hypothetical protein